MNIFGKIIGAIFGKKSSAPASAPQSPVPTSAAAPAAEAPLAPEPIDVAAFLDAKASRNPEKLDWRRSIVDLMKLVGMESSLSERRELADELGYQGDKSDSARMNMWLHKQVLKKLAENGGKVPAELLD